MNTKSQQAQEYAKQIQKDFIHNRLVTEELSFKDIEAAWLDGYTAAEQSDLRISVAKLREVLEELASVRGVVNESVDEIINRVKKEI